MNEQSQEGKPPLFRSWKRWYVLVFLTMVAQVIVYLLITESFS